MRRTGLFILSITVFIGTIILFFKKKNKPIVSNNINAFSMSITDNSSNTVPQLMVSPRALIGSIRVTDKGMIESGMISYKIKNVGDNNGTINVGTGDRILKPDEIFSYNEFLNPNVKPSCEVSYDATTTEFIIDTVYA